MPAPPDRIHLEIRSDGSAATRIREILAAIDPETLPDGTRMPIELAPSSQVLDHPLLVIGPDDEEAMLAAVEEGALGYVIDTSSQGDIESALVSLSGGAAVIPPMMLGSLLRHIVRRRQAIAAVEERLSVLTDREREIVEQLSSGKKRREIAEFLFISPETVRTHIQRAMAKLDVHSQTELLALLGPLRQGPS